MNLIIIKKNVNFTNKKSSNVDNSKLICSIKKKNIKNYPQS